MARIRTIKPDFWNDEKIGALSRDARLLFVAMWNVADDEGLLRWSPEYLKSVAFIYDDDLGVAGVSALMKEITDLGLVFPYLGSTHQRLAYIVNFRKHQKINRPQPGKLTPPSVQNGEVTLMYAHRDGWVCQLCHNPIPCLPNGQFPPALTYPGIDMASVSPSLDHIVPRINGGSHYPSNIRIAHLSCNKARGPREVEVFEPTRSVAGALEKLRQRYPETLSPPDSLSGSLNCSVNDSPIPPDGPGPGPGGGPEGPRTGAELRKRRSLSDSLNDSRTSSVTDSLPEEEEEGEEENPNPPSGDRAPSGRDARSQAPAHTRATPARAREATPPPPAPAEKRNPRGARIPNDFTVTPDMVAWAAENTPGVDGRRETARFIDYWKAKTGRDATKLDWTATWRNWMRKAHDQLPTSRRCQADDTIAAFEAMKTHPWQPQALPGGRA